MDRSLNLPSNQWFNKLPKWRLWEVEVVPKPTLWRVKEIWFTAYYNQGKIIHVNHTKIILKQLQYPHQLCRVQRRKLCQLFYVDVEQWGYTEIEIICRDCVRLNPFLLSHANDLACWILKSIPPICWDLQGDAYSSVLSQLPEQFIPMADPMCSVFSIFLNYLFCQRCILFPIQHFHPQTLVYSHSSPHWVLLF